MMEALIKQYCHYTAEEMIRRIIRIYACTNTNTEVVFYTIRDFVERVMGTVLADSSRGATRNSSGLTVTFDK